MKVLVPIKRVIDPYVKIRVKADQQNIEADHAKRVINPFDEIALEEAIRWKEAGRVTEITVVSIGEAAVQETLRHALALGADKAIHIQTEQKLAPLNIAKVLKHTALQYMPEVVIMGKQAIDDDCNQTGQMLAGLLDWPQATFASKVVLSEDGKRAEVSREVDAGIEVLEVMLPAVITTDLRLNEPRYAALQNIMKAKRKPLETLDLETLDIQISQPVERIACMPPEARKAGKMVQDVTELVHYLHEVEKVI